MSGSTPSASGISNLFKKPAKAAEGTKADGSPEVPQVPMERIVSSPRRTLGKGRRDTVLTGADGV